MNIKSNVLVTSLTVFVLFLTSANSEANSNRFFIDPRFPTEVQAAHELFLQGKFDLMVGQIKAALLKYPGDVGIERDVLALFDAAYELKGNAAVSPDYTLPDGVTWMSAAVKRLRAATGAIHYRFTMSLDYDRNSEVEQLRVVKYPNQVILDKQSGIGEFEPSEDGQLMNLWAAAAFQREPIENGLYLFDVKTKGNAVRHGYFIFTRMASTESPEVTSPTPDLVYTEARPTFTYRNFVSSEYRHYERRKVFVAAGYADGRQPDLFQYSSPTKSTPPTSVRVDKPLESGEYNMRVSYRERRDFGPITLSRESDTAVPFSVKVAK